MDESPNDSAADLRFISSQTVGWGEWIERTKVLTESVARDLPRGTRTVTRAFITGVLVVLYPFQHYFRRWTERQPSMIVLQEFLQRWNEDSADAAEFLYSAYREAGSGRSFQDFGKLSRGAKGAIFPTLFEAQTRLQRWAEALDLVNDYYGNVLETDAAELYLMRAQCLDEMGQREKAVAQLQRGLAQDALGEVAERLEELRKQDAKVPGPN